MLKYLFFFTILYFRLFESFASPNTLLAPRSDSVEKLSPESICNATRILEQKKIRVFEIHSDPYDLLSLTRNLRLNLNFNELVDVLNFFHWTRTGKKLIPDSLKTKLSEQGLENRFIKCVLWDISSDFWEIVVQLRSSMTPMEEKALWEIFHSIYPDLCNRRTLDFQTQPNVKTLSLLIQRRMGIVNLLDMGCGPFGTFLRELKLRFGNKIKAHGIDLHIAGPAEEVELKEGDLTHMPYEDNSFDLIYEIAVTTYFNTEDSLKKLLNEVMRVLAPGGECYLADYWNPLLGPTLKSIGIPFEIKFQNDGTLIKKLKRDSPESMKTALSATAVSG